MSPERGDRTNHCRRLFARWHGFESGGRHFFTHRTRWHASRYSYGTGKFIKHDFPEGKANPKTTRKEAKITSNLTPEGKGEDTALERGCNGIVFFLGENFGPWEAHCLCFVFLVCMCLSVFFIVYCSIRLSYFQRAEKHERRRGSSR